MFCPVGERQLDLSGEVKNVWKYASIPPHPYVFTERCLIKHKDNFAFTSATSEQQMMVTARPVLATVTLPSVNILYKLDVTSSWR
jgi:hypothetical protein